MPKKISPAEPDARDELSRKALDERADELGTAQPGAADGESPGAAEPGTIEPQRDPAADAASFASVLEVVVCVAARVVAWRFKSTIPVVAGTVLPRAQGFSQSAGEKIGPVVGLRFPVALPAVGGFCSMLAWWLRTLPPPQMPKEREGEKPPAPVEQPPPPDGSWKGTP